ncbi:MAG: YidC/Oxa1 family membrane protein insertase [Parcubacteria group bacterium]|nr:YidC/Oxa1 family membrane protein insertase [Parcubacteria group bacterium]
MFHTFLYRPIFNALVILYDYVAFQDLGVAIVLLTIAVRIILFPLFHTSTRQQLVLQRLQPHIKKIQNDHKDDREKQAKALMALYKEHRVNPFSGILLLIVQLPILIALYRVFLNDFSPAAFSDLYSFIAPPSNINHFFLKLIDLSQRSILMVGLAAAVQYVQGKLTLTEQSEKIAKQMVLMGPLFTVVVLAYLPSAAALYWLVSSIFSILQQLIIMRLLKHDERLSTNSKTS